jgi:hypothetical protein
VLRKPNIKYNARFDAATQYFREKRLDANIERGNIKKEQGRRCRENEGRDRTEHTEGRPVNKEGFKEAWVLVRVSGE